MKLMGKRRTVVTTRPRQVDYSMRMLIIAGVLMLALLIAVVGTVSADGTGWPAHAAAAATAQAI